MKPIRNIITKHLRGRERGQMVMFIALAVIPITFLVGVGAADVNAWFSERRGAQQEADLSALAGAYELLSAGSTAGQAQTAASQYITKNDQTADASIKKDLADKSCFNGTRLDAVTVDVTHNKHSYFASIFGIGGPQPGAHAKACAGSIIRTSGLRPWAVSIPTSGCFSGSGANRAPLFGQTCNITDGSNPSNVGSISFPPLNPPNGPSTTCDKGPGGNDYRNSIQKGAGVTCAIGNNVTTKDGLTTGPTKQGLQALLATEGDCDNKFGNNNGIDDFNEALELVSGTPGTATAVYAPRGCVSPRLVTIVLTQDVFGHGSQTMTIAGFAGFFITGCTKGGTLYPKCNPGGNIDSIQGVFINIVDTQGDIGAFDPYGTKAIRLHE